MTSESNLNITDPSDGAVTTSGFPLTGARSLDERIVNGESRDGLTTVIQTDYTPRCLEVEKSKWGNTPLLHFLHLPRR